ncbi:chaperone protein dnaJ 72-like [Rutidosis leptorrhynchoides]|uniref:chaperone protein dnaJ 72-like n=1 Tax=Rutidosis leptorrhynchoides TaxID=125765 RepID=UPI003A98CF3C
MDYYKILGLNTNATKDEIKQAFRTIAKKFHPDKHSSSPKSIKDGATLKFKQASEAYEVLVDDRKRADYNSSYNRSSSYSGGSGYGNYGYGYTYDNRRKNSSSYENYYNYNNYGNKKATVSKLQIIVGYLNSRAFLLNVAFAGAILSGLAAVEIGRDAIWRSQNPGKSFEEAMESIHKTKAVKEEE